MISFCFNVWNVQFASISRIYTNSTKIYTEASKNTISEIVFGIEMSRVVTKVFQEIGMPKQ